MKKIAITLGVIQVFVAFWAIPAGLSLIFTPDGSGIGLPKDLLHGSPFSDFFIPGLFLFFVNGLLNVVGAVFSFKQVGSVGKMGVSLGMLLVIWIIVQLYYTNGIISFMQPLFLGIGVIETFLGVWLILKINARNKRL